MGNAGGDIEFLIFIWHNKSYYQKIENSMILTPHLIIGAVIATKINFWPLVILFAFLSHYFLDSLPHAEYLIENIKKKKWEKSRLDFLKLTLDLGVGSILIVFIHYLTKANYFILFTAAFFAILPDILTVLNWLCPNNDILKYHFSFHQKIHFPKNKKLPFCWEILIQIVVIIFGFFLLY